LSFSFNSVVFVPSFRDPFPFVVLRKDALSNIHNSTELLHPRRRAEHALLAVVQEAYVHGVSTRKVDELMKALGLHGVSKSEVSRICGDLDPLVDAFRTRPLTDEHPYVWVDATYHEVRVDGHVTSQATVVAVGLTTEGERQVLGIDVGPSEDRAFWTAFLRSLVKRGLKGVRLVISDAHVGLKQSISTVLCGATWQEEWSIAERR
jgi:transposase-like protein